MVGIVDSISKAVNQKVTVVDKKVKELTPPGPFKKVLQLSIKVFTAIDLQYKDAAKRPVQEAMQGTVNIIDFLSTYKNVMYWVNLFSKDSLDQEKLKASIESSLCASHKNDSKQKKIANKVFADVMKKENYHSKGEVSEAIEVSLIERGYTSEKAKQLTSRVVIQQKERSAIQFIYKACFTVADLGGNITTLKQWNILDLSQLAVSIGDRSPVFMFVVKTGMGKVLGVVASVGLVANLGEVIYKTGVHATHYYYAVNEEEREKFYKELRDSVLDVISTGVDLGATLTPLLLTLNPTVVVALAIAAKGTGLICIWIR